MTLSLQSLNNRFFRSIRTAGTSALIFLFLCSQASADPKSIEKVRKFYKQHGLDFFGDLMSDQVDMAADDQRRAKLELLTDDARSKALDQLEKLLQSSRGTQMEGELLLRKATMLSDRAKTAAFFQNNPLKTSRLKSANFYLEQSIATFLTIEKKYDTHPMMDVVLFSIAYNYHELKGGNIDSAFKYYGRLVAKFPDSGLVGDSRLAMAEILFDKRKFKESIDQLREIVKAEHPRLKNFALYKMAWSYYNMGDLDSAIHSLERVIDGVNAAGVQRARLELRKEALQDLVVIYAERGGPEFAKDAPAYFDRVAKTPQAISEEYFANRAKRIAAYREKKAEIPTEDLDAFQLPAPYESNEMLLRLTNIYKDQGKHEHALVTAEELIQRMGGHPKVVVLYRLKAESAEKLRKRDIVERELSRLATLMKRDLSPIGKFESGLPMVEFESVQEYTRANGVEADAERDFKIKLPIPPAQQNEYERKGAEIDYYRKALFENGLSALKDFSNFFHGEWAKASNADTAKYAMDVYDLGVSTLLEPWRGHDLDISFDLRFRRAQLRLANRKWLDAAQDFSWIALRVGNLAETTGKKPKDYSMDNSIKGNIGALESAAKEMGKNVNAELRQKLLEAYDLYLASHLNEAKKSAPIRVETAKILATSAYLLKEEKKSEPAAMDRMIFYSLHFPLEAEGSNLTQEVLAALSSQGRWEELQRYSQKLIDRKFYASKPIAKEISKSFEYASLRLIEKFEGEKEWKKASNAFAEFGKRNPDSPFLSQALLKAANAAFQINDLKLAVERLEEATKAPEAKTRLDAWLGLEPYYRRAFWWKRLEDLYVQTNTKANLKTIRDLELSVFMSRGEELIAPDPDVAKLEKEISAFEKGLEPFYKLRFAKSNNNPTDNFKKKTTAHGKLVDDVDKLVKRSPKSLQGAALLWAQVMKTELLLEFAETLETAAMPSVLSAATEVDKKSYMEAIFGNAKDLKEQAVKTIKKGMELSMEIDNPLPFESRINALAEKLGVVSNLAREDFSQTWEKRPKPDFTVKTQTPEQFEADLRKLGMKLIEAKEKEEIREISYEVAKLYAENGMFGFSQATTATILNENKSDDWNTRALRHQYDLDFLRLPAKYKKFPEKMDIPAQIRWDLSRFFVGASKDCAKKGFDENECQWFKLAVESLLRVKPQGATVSLSKH